MKPNITLPPKTHGNPNIVTQCEGNLVIVGANGSGKSRMGAWIERTQPELVHRISAQRALNIPEFAPLKNLAQAEKWLFIGDDREEITMANRDQMRWGRTPEISMLNDYEKLLSTLFARTIKRDQEHTSATKLAGAYVPVEEAPIDVIEKVWSDIMPHRKIIFDDGKVLTAKEGQPNYHGKNMSDGERVALYLIGQCLCVKENSIIVVDEPEIHLHKSIMVRLWNKIEELCPNKLIVYITHDLDFVASRSAAKKIWIREYNGSNQWIWEEVPEIDGLPESLIVEVLGSRKSIIFTEGEKDSYDTILYQAAYPAFHIMPRGGCEKVIESTKALQGVPAIHHISASGIIDSDFRVPEEITALAAHRVFTINVAEIENLLCVDPLIELVANYLALNSGDVLASVHEFVLQELQREFQTQVSSRVEKEVRFKLSRFEKADNNQQGITDGIDNVMAGIDVPVLYAAATALYQGIIDAADYNSALRYYNRKSLAKRISRFFNLGNDGYPSLVLRLLKTEHKAGIVAAIAPYIPVIA